MRRDGEGGAGRGWMKGHRSMSARRKYMKQKSALRAREEKVEKEEMTGIKRGSRGDGGRMKKSRERQSEEGGEGDGAGEETG